MSEKIISNAEWAAMRYNPLSSLGTRDFLDIYPELRNAGLYGSCSENKSDLIRRYISAIYSQDSPLIKFYTDLDTRKKAALTYIDFNRAEKLKQNLVEKLTVDYAAIIIAYLSFTSSREWRRYCSLEAMSLEYNTKIIAHVEMSSDKDALQAVSLKGKMSEILLGIDQQLNAIQDKLFQSDTVLEKEAQGIILGSFTPENISKHL